jgi:hypothetical protein
VDRRGDRPDRLVGLGQRRARVDQHVGARLDGPVVLAPGVGVEQRSTRGRRGVGRVVVEVVGAAVHRRLGGQGAARAEKPFRGTGGRRPVRQFAPLLGAPHVDLHPAALVLPPVEYIPEPAQRLAHGEAEQLGVVVRPRADDQPRVLAGGAHRRVVLQLPGQEDVVPAADQLNGRVHVAYPLHVYPPRPVLVVRCRVGQPLLEERHLGTERLGVHFGQW